MAGSASATCTAQPLSTGAALVGVHVSTLYFDPYAQLKLTDILLPFAASYRPVWLGLGTLALDTLAIVTVVSLLRHRVGPYVFKGVHWATYALWPMALLHAIGSGTDAGACGSGRGCAVRQRRLDRSRLAFLAFVSGTRLGARPRRQVTS